MSPKACISDSDVAAKPVKAKPRKIVLISKDERWKIWVGRIAASWQKCVEGVVETGKLLTEAKANLEPGQFESMVRLKLPSSPRTARMLMYLAENPAIANRKHVAVLPPHWGTLYQLAHLPPALIQEKIESGEINAKMERRDAVAL